MGREEFNRHRVEEIRRLARERGIAITRKGDAYHLIGGGIDLLVSDLAFVQPGEIAARRGDSRREAEP